MEKSIKEIIKKASCLIMICALVICSYPIQVVAAGFEISQDAEEKKDSGDKVSTVTKPESSTAEQTTEPKSSTTEQTTEPESSTTEPTSELESSTEESTTEEDTIEESTTEEDTTEESTTEEDTIEESTTEEDTIEEPTTEEDTTEEPTTEEDTTEESTTEEDTTGETVTEVDTAEEVVIVAAEVVKNAAVINRNNNINVTVDSVNATIDSIDQPTYVSGENGNVGYFKVSVSGSARADFSVTAITGDGDPEQEDGDSKQEGEDTEQTSGETGEEDEGTEQTSGEISEEDEGTEQTSGETGEEDEGTEQTSGETDEEDEGTEQTSGETGEEDEDTKQEGVDPTQEDEDTKQEGVDPTQESKDTELTIGGAVSTTEDTDQTDTSSDTADVDQIKRDLASQYHVELRMICPSGGSKKIDESYMTVNGGNMSASVSCSEVSLTETGCYEFYIVVITPDSESVESVRQQVEITIPAQVGVKISEPEIKLAGYQECKEGNICTAFEIPYAVTAQISLTGIDDSVLAEQRESEIEYCLSQCKLAVKLDDQVLEEKALQEDDLVKSLMKSNDAVYTYTTEGSVKVCSAGEYCLQAVFNDSVTVPKTVEIDKVDQQLRYTLDKGDGKHYRFDETVTCSPEDSIYAGESQCAETDQDGNAITDKKLTIEQDGLSYKISTTNKNCDDKQTHYITIFHEGNEIYHSASQTIPITFERVAPQITYQCDDKENVHRYQSTIRYTIPKFIDEDKVTCYEVTDDGNGTIIKAHNLEIKKKDSVISVDNYNKDNRESSVHHLVFKYEGDSVYRSDKQEISLTYEKASQDIRYTITPNKNIYSFDEKPAIEFEIVKGANPDVSVAYYVLDEDGNQVKTDNLTADKKLFDSKNFTISAKNPEYADDITFYATFIYKGNEVYKDETKTIPLHFERLENNVCYVPSSIDEIYEYGEVITYSYQSGNLAGGITCYESDAAGNRIEDSQSLHIEKGEDGSFQVSGMSLSDAGKPFYVTFEHKENEVYKVGKQTFAFNVGKVKLEGCIKVNTVEKNYIFFKNRTMYVDVVVKAPKDNLTKDDAKKIKFNIQASLNSGSQNVFENMKCSLVKISYCGDRVNYRYKVNKESAQKLSSERTYTVRAVADYTEVSDKEVYYEEFSKVFDSLEVKRSQLGIDVQDEIIVELNNDENQLDFVIKGERIEGEEGKEAFPVSCHIKADDPDVIAIKDNGVYETRKGGSTTITITVDDSSKYDIYEEYSTRVTITVKSPSNTDYTLNGQDPESFLKNPKATVGDEKWYDKDITLCFGENNLYNELCYRVSGNDDWKHVKARSVVIGESMPATYEFYFCNTERNVASCIFKGNKVEEGKLEVMEKIGVDKTAPSWNPQLIANQQPSEHSTDTIRYFSDEIVLTGYVGNKPGDRKLVDSGSGIQKVFVQYGDSEEWTEYKVDERYSGSYGLGLTENKNYGTVKMKAVDYLGHESNEAVYATEVCIDTVVPVVTMTPIDRNGNVSDYDDDSWTNQQLRFAISSLKDTQVSGIYCYEYAFIPRGSKMEIGKTEWKQIDEDELTLVFGTVLKHTQQTKEGTFLYTKDNSKKEKTESKAVRELEEYAKINGTLYVRAESNAGLVTTENDIQTNSKEVRIWQENLAEAKVIASSKPDSDTGWYNKQTGPVSLSFEYPEYDSENVAPAVGIVYTLTTQTDKDGEAVIVNKAFYKGIIDESSGKVIEVCDYKDKNSYVNLEKDGNIQIDKDSINTLTVYVEDVAGNQSDKTIFQINADFTAPQNLYADADGEELFIHLDGGESIVYKKFSQNAVRVNAHADYGISEKKGLYMALVKEQGAKEGISSGNAREELVMEPCSRGLIYLCAVDGAGNLSEGWTDGIVVDNLAPTGDSQPEIFIDAKGQNEAEFYHEDIPISICVADAPDHDNYSGLKTVSYTIGRDYQATEENMPVFESNEISLSWEQIEKNRAFATDNIVIDAAKNESNNAYITITAADNAGNITTTTQELQIDVTAPQIEVTFNNNDAVNGTYYNSSRVARVDITELNFDPTQVSFKIYKDGEEDYTLVPSAASWNTSEGNVNTAYITFAEDGDYSLEVQCTDLAGNESDVEVTDSFTIDQTKPVVDVVYDNNNAWKGNYYNQARTATITVTEHNFDEKDFVITVTPNAALSGWTHNGDVHKASIRFDNEEHYSYAIDYTDLAGNKMDVFATEEFYIDRNVPTIQISGVADHSANAGEVIPVVMVADENYDADSVQITLQNSKGQQIALKQSVSGASGGYSYTLTNVNEQPDEIYTLTAAATDMAGNTSELSYLFSLNRNGSVYDLSRISVLVDKGYVRYADLQDLQIKEMNVNTIERFEIYVTRNGEIISSTEKKTRPNNADANTIYYAQKVNGNDEIGYEYDYTIYKESFRQEGIYNILLYSKDLAGNEVNNTLTEKEAELSFVVDNTAPTVVIEGVEAGVLYSEETKDVNVYVSDNFKLQEAYFKLVDEDGKVIQTYPYMEMAKENGDIVSITLPSSEKKLSIEYYAVDAAGNEMTTLPEENTAAGFMISTNAWIRYINNKRAVAGTIAAGVGAVPLSAAGMFFSRKRKMLKISK